MAQYTSNTLMCFSELELPFSIATLCKQSYFDFCNAHLPCSYQVVVVKTPFFFLGVGLYHLLANIQNYKRIISTHFIWSK